VTTLLAMLDSHPLTLVHLTKKVHSIALVSSTLVQLGDVSTLTAVLMEHGPPTRQMLIVDKDMFQTAIQEIVVTTIIAMSPLHPQETFQLLATLFQSTFHWFVMTVTDAPKIFAIQTTMEDLILAITIPMEPIISSQTFVLMLNHVTTPLAQLTDATILQSLAMLEISAPTLSAMQPPTTLALLLLPQNSSWILVEFATEMDFLALQMTRLLLLPLLMLPLLVLVLVLLVLSLLVLVSLLEEKDMTNIKKWLLKCPERFKTAVPTSLLNMEERILVSMLPSLKMEIDFEKLIKKCSFYICL